MLSVTATDGECSNQKRLPARKIAARVRWYFLPHLEYGRGVPVLKYLPQIQHLSQCPPPNANGFNGTAFRFVGSALSAKSFEPPGIESPRRVLKTRADQCCGLYGLSLFKTEAQARQRRNELVAGSPKLAQKWTHIAEVVVSPVHGQCTPPDRRGHFELHEYTGTQLHLCSKLLGACK